MQLTTKSMMQKTLILVLCLALPTFLSATERDASTAAADRLSEEERTELLGLLEGSRDELLDHVSGLSTAALNFKPGPDRWSVAEVIDHIYMVESALFANIEGALAAEPSADWVSETAGKTDRMFRLLPIRITTFQAPEPFVPKKNLKPKKLLKEFKAQRTKAIDVIRDSTAPTKAHLAEHPVLGQLNVPQWALFFALHNIRHNQQIVEVMADPDFPH